MQNASKRQNAEYLKALWALASCIWQAPDIGSALEESFSVVLRMSGAQNGSIWLVTDPVEGDIKAAFASGPSSDKVMALRLQVGEGIPGGVIESGQTQLVSDCQSDPRWRERHDQTTGFFIKTLLCVPISTSAGCIGCIELTNRLDGSLFTERDAQLCEDCAAFMAIAMDERGFFPREAPQSDEILLVNGISLDGAHELSFDIRSNELLICLVQEAPARDRLFDALCGLEKPERGNLTLATNQNIYESAQSALDYRRNTVGIVDSRAQLLSDLTVRANIALAASLAELPMAVEQALSLSDMTEHQQKIPADLNEAQALRAQISRAMVKNPRMLILREPAERVTRAQIIRILPMLEIIAQNYCSVVILTCDKRFTHFGGRFMRVRDGEIDRMQVNLHKSSAETLFL